MPTIKVSECLSQCEIMIFYLLGSDFVNLWLCTVFVVLCHKLTYIREIHSVITSNNVLALVCLKLISRCYSHSWVCDSKVAYRVCVVLFGRLTHPSNLMHRVSFLPLTSPTSSQRHKLDEKAKCQVICCCGSRRIKLCAWAGASLPVRRDCDTSWCTKCPVTERCFEISLLVLWVCTECFWSLKLNNCMKWPRLIFPAWLFFLFLNQCCNFNNNDYYLNCSVECEGEVGSTEWTDLNTRHLE